MSINFHSIIIVLLCNINLTLIPAVIEVLLHTSLPVLIMKQYCRLTLHNTVDFTVICCSSHLIMIAHFIYINIDIACDFK